MRVSRIQFDDSEPTDSISRRIACAFDPGDIIKIRGDFFKMSNLRVMNQTIEANVVGDKYTLILNPGDPIPEIQLKVTKPSIRPVPRKPEPEEDAWEDEVVSDPEPVVQEPVIQEPIKSLNSEPASEPVVQEPIVEPDVLLEVVSEPVVPEVDIDFGGLPGIDNIPPKNDNTETPESDQVTPPLTSEVLTSRPIPSIDGKALEIPTSESGEYKLEVPRSKFKIEPGQIWQSKDTRRNSPPFVVKNVDNEFVYPDTGKRISLNRMIRYKRVS